LLADQPTKLILNIENTKAQFSEIRDEEARDRLWNSAVHQRWAKLMEPLMHMNEQGIVAAGELTEIFHLETRAGRDDIRAKP
jgi:L-rhamnose mutarotase